MPVSLLIDGYNLLHATGIIGRGVGPGTLERSRGALLGFLEASLDPEELSRTVVVFDAGDDARGVTQTMKHGEMTVCYARGYEDADAMIEELIRADSAPRSLTVVSSDHRVQRAAHRRRAKAIDSDRWYAEIIQRRRRGDQAAASEPLKPAAPLNPAEVQYWLREFGPTPEEEKEQDVTSNDATSDDSATPKETQLPDAYNPFPAGYGEDIIEEENDK